MFIATVLIITFTVGAAVPLRYSYGPYKTRQECNDRVMQVQGQVFEHLSEMGLASIQGTCREIKLKKSAPTGQIPLSI